MWAKKGPLGVLCFLLLFVIISSASAAITRANVDIGTLCAQTNNETDHCAYIHFTSDVAGSFRVIVVEKPEEPPEPPDDPC